MSTVRPADPTLVVVTGLPAAGKSTLGAALAGGLGWPLLDKDTVLEALFEALGSPDREARGRLSRASDEVLFSLAAEAGSAVLVNWWDPSTAPDRLRAITPRLVEVFCDCPADVAAARFAGRVRHPGHHDPVRSPAGLAGDVARVRAAYAGPLGLGEPVRVDTTGPVDLADVVARVGELLAAPA